jgi:hypothetical protein
VSAATHGALSPGGERPDVTWDLSLVDTDRGRRIAIGREIGAPASDVWAAFARPDRWHEWGPPVTGVDYDGEAVAAGTAGRVRAFGLVWVPFRVTSAADRSWTWTVGGVAPPADGHRVEDLDEERCRAVLELPPWAPWYLPLCALALWNLAAATAAEN